MSDSGHHHRNHRRKNPVAKLFDFLTGRRHHHSHHRSHFPGINLPEDSNHDIRQGNESREMSPLVPAKPEENTRGFSDSTSDNLDQYRQDMLKSRYPVRKKSFFASIDHYFKQRAFRREEHKAERMRMKIRRRHQKEYRKDELGRSLGKKLFTITREEELLKEKKALQQSRQDTQFRNLTITLNSVIVYLTTYVLVYLFYWLTSMLVASWYGLDSTLYFYDLKFNDHSNLWTRFNILLVTGIPPFLCLFLGIFLYRVLFKKRRFVGLQKLFILWSSFHLFNHFFGAFPSGVVTSEGFGYVAAWMYMNTAFKFMFSLISLFLLSLIGYYSAEYILETSDSLHRIKPENRKAFMLMQIALPWLIGTAIMLLIRVPENFKYPYETLMLLSAIFLVIPPFFNEKVKPQLNLLRVKKKRNINMGYLAMMIALVLFLRIMLGIGLHFLIEINISISPAVT